MSDEEHLLDRIKPYEMVCACFSEYLSWLCANVPVPKLDDYSMVRSLRADGPDVLAKKIEELETKLQNSRRILGLSIADFCRRFGFKTDLLVADPEKLVDILSEPLFVLDLASAGFSSIQKLPASKKIGQERIPMADFVASLGKLRFAVELKTVRSESWVKPGGYYDGGLQPNWWTEMLLSNARTKVADKDFRILRQLESTRTHYHCDRVLLAIHSRRSSPGAFMQIGDYFEALRSVKIEVGELSMVDYLAWKFSETVVFYPDLPRTS